MNITGYRVIDNQYVIPNGYINATILSKNFNGEIIGYLKLKSVKAYIRYIDQKLNEHYQELNDKDGIKLLVFPKSVVVVRHTINIPFEDVGTWLHPLLWYDFCSYSQPEIKFELMNTIDDIYAKRKASSVNQLRQELNYCEFLSNHIRSDFKSCLKEHLIRVFGDDKHLNIELKEYEKILKDNVHTFPSFFIPESELTDVDKHHIRCFENYFCGKFNVAYPEMDFDLIFDNSVKYISKIAPKKVAI